MTRIVAGRAGGRAITVPVRGTRPTSDRVREALFSRLEHYGVVRGARVLDLFAGSGALGLEAASRGAQHVQLVERSREAAQTCRQNTAKLQLEGVQVVEDRAETFTATQPPEPWDLVLIDPPYDIETRDLTGILQNLAQPGHLMPDAVVVIERSRRTPQPELPETWELLTKRDYGETTLWFAGPPLPEQPA